MSSFLQTVFERLTPEVIRIENSLLKSNVTENGAIDFASLLTSAKTEAFIFNANALAFHKDESAAAKAFACLQPFMTHKHFSSVLFENINFDKDFPGSRPSLQKPAFTCDKIALSNSFFSQESLDVFFESLSSTNAGQIATEGVALSGRTEKLAESFKSMNITQLKMTDAGLNHTDYKNLAAVLPALPLTRFDISDRTPNKPTEYIEDVISALPSTVTHIKLNGLALDEKAVAALCKKMNSMKKLQEIDLNNCGLSAENVVEIASSLPLSVKKAGLENAGLSDAAVNALTAAAKRPGCLLHETNILPCFSSITHPDSRFSAGNAAELTCTEYENKAEYMKLLQQEKAVLFSKSKNNTAAFKQASIRQKSVQR